MMRFVFYTAENIVGNRENTENLSSAHAFDLTHFNATTDSF